MSAITKSLILKDEDGNELVQENVNGIGLASDLVTYSPTYITVYPFHQNLVLDTVYTIEYVERIPGIPDSDLP